MVVYHDPNDPLWIAIAPPPGETPEQRRVREAEEDEARRVSLRIDEVLKADKAAMKKRNKVKVLVLGQSESGKSTTIKNFQLAYAHQAWLDERASWRSVIYLNLIRSVNIILDILDKEMSRQNATNRPPSPVPAHPLVSSESSLETETDFSDDATLVTQPLLHFTDRHKVLKLRLAPLREVQADLERQIGAGASEPPDLSTYYHFTDAAPFVGAEDLAARSRNPRQPNEFFVRSNCGWKETLSRLHPQLSMAPGHPGPTNRKRQAAIDIVAGCGEAIKSLWTDGVVQAALKLCHIRLEEESGFFLDDVSRIATRDYEPSDDDVLRARLRTVGVQEYKFTIEKGSEVGSDWYMFDVGGTRTSRAVWYPYFEDCNAIIFMAPISCFDENLNEDRRVNRVTDSLLLWKAVCNSKLLSKAQFVLFLNKCDLLVRKLKRGIRVQDHFPDFGDQSNDLKTVASFFQQKFKKILKNNNSDRPLHTHMTSVTNTKTTAETLKAVRDIILRKTLTNAIII